MLPAFLRLLSSIAWLIFISSTAPAQTGPHVMPASFLIPSSNNYISLNSVQRVDSIAAGERRISFANMYKQSMQHVQVQLKDKDSAVQNFIKNFELKFAGFFINAALENKSSQLSATSEWQSFFSNPAVPFWKKVLLGVNAHTNIDLWQSLVYGFSEQQIKENKKQMQDVQLSVAKVYYEFFDSLLLHNNRLRLIHFFTLGLDRKLGERLVYKWRNRNIKLALLFYSNPARFRRRWEMIQRKKTKNDEIILKS